MSDDQIRKEKQAKEQQEEKERREKKLKDAKIIFVVGGPGSGKVIVVYLIKLVQKRIQNKLIIGNSMRENRG